MRSSNPPRMKQNHTYSTLILTFVIYSLTLNLALVQPIQTSGNGTLPADASADGGETEGGLVFNFPSSIGPKNDPQDRLNIVNQARNNEISAEMITNKTRAQVSCETGEILVKINFTEPFRGVGYADYDRSSPCKFFGEGANYYEMRLPLKGCGTKQEAPRLFVNNIVLRFHRSLELEEDEVKTIVCRYPPPEAPAPPPPPGLPAKIIQAPLEPAKLTQYEPFVIIAGLLFGALLLAGIGTTTYTTRKQVLKPINTPLPITSTEEHDTYIDKQSIITIEDLETNMKIVPMPKLSTQIVDDVFITNIHEIDTAENLVHNMRRLDRRECEYDDTYITNQDEIVDEEILTHQRLQSVPSRIELRTIEDTFITNVDEVVDQEDTIHFRDQGRNYC